MTLPAWMYADPADVVERIETAERRAQLRVQHVELQGLETLAKPRAPYGLVGAATVVLIKRMRIRELMRRRK